MSRTAPLAALIALLALGGASAAGLLWPLPEAQPWPALASMKWQPDLFVGANLPTMDRAAARLADKVRAEPGDGPLWIRLDAFDLCGVGDCESCQPPPDDPNRFVGDDEPTELGSGQLRFAALAEKALRGTRARPYLVVPCDQRAPEQFRYDGLLVLLASPPLSTLDTPDHIARRVAQAEGWRAVGADARPLVGDGLSELGGLPLCADLLLEQAEQLPHAVLVARDAQHATTRGPEALAKRIRAVVVEGAKLPIADRWRVDDPDTARLLDIHGALGAGDDSLVASTLDALAATAAWDDARAAGQPLPGGLADKLAKRAALAGERGVSRPVSGPLSARFEAFVRGAGPLPVAKLPRLRGVVVDGERQPGEWDGALHLTLTSDDWGQTTARPGEVWLGVMGDQLVAAAVGTEPVPAEATLRDRLVITLGRGGVLARVAGDVRGRVTMQRLAARGGQPEPSEPAGARCVGLFDGPGWSLEMALPLAALAMPADGRLTLNLATEHLRGRDHLATLWVPTAGGLWQPERNGQAQLD